MSMMMKRNLKSSITDPSSNDELFIIKERLDQLFPNCSDNLRQILINNKGTYIEELNHIRLDSLKGISQELLSYSNDLKYHYLNCFEALYCLESNELSIFYKGLPLSLAEAYNLLLSNKSDFRNYRIFQRLNRTGFICLQPSNKSRDKDTTSTKDLIVGSDLHTDVSENKCSSLDNNSIDCIYEIDSIYLDYKKVLHNLRAHGPQEWPLNTDSDVFVGNHYNVLFDLYQKENFLKNKPSKGKEGKPDYHLIVCNDLNDNYIQSIGNRIGQIPKELNDKLMFAIADGENTICFVQFSSENSHELVLLQT